jgi:hypothetical protein
VNFHGLVRSSYSGAVIDGTHKSGCWWLAVGQIAAKYEGGIPACMGQIADTMTLEVMLPPPSAWRVIARQDIQAALFASSVRSTFATGSSPSDDAYMAMPSDPAAYRDGNGAYTFRLTYGGDRTVINGRTFDQLTASKTEYRFATWTQTAWLTETVPGTFTCLDEGCEKWGPKGHDSTYWRHTHAGDCVNFHGLVRSSSSAAVFDGTHKSGCWWLAVGAAYKHEGGIPACMGQIADTMILEVLAPP